MRKPLGSPCFVLGAGFAGMTTIRLAGAQVLSRLQAAQREGVLQQQLVASDMALAVAGLLLIVPGLLSDGLAMLVLIRPVRYLLGGAVAAGWSRAVTIRLPGTRSTARNITLTSTHIKTPPIPGDPAALEAHRMTVSRWKGSFKSSTLKHHNCPLRTQTSQTPARLSPPK